MHRVGACGGGGGGSLVLRVMDCSAAGNSKEGRRDS